MVEQNLPLCLGLAALGGVGTVLASIIVIIPSDREKKGHVVSDTFKNIALALHIVLQLLLSFFIYPAATWFGPVSLVRPTALSATLLSNMLFIGVIMQREAVDKNVRVATYNTILAALLLPLVGPGVQDEQDFFDLLQDAHALIWVAFLSTVFVVATGFMLCKDLSETTTAITEGCLLCVGTTASVLSPTVSRAVSLVDHGKIRIVLVFAYLILQVVWMYEYLVESTVVASRTKFVPTFTIGSMLINALTGVIVWDDWRVMNSWVGYASVLLQLALGIYLISDFDIVKQQVEEETKVKRDLSNRFLNYVPSADSIDAEDAYQMPKTSNRRLDFALKKKSKTNSLGSSLAPPGENIIL